MDHLRCVVERITYQNADNGYTVLKCAVKNAQDLVTVVGIMPDTHVGSVLALEGVWKVDAKYGRQFSVEKFEETLPAECPHAQNHFPDYILDTELEVQIGVRWGHGLF